MAFGQDFLKGLFGSDYLKDYRHASKTFLSAGGELLPRQKYLYHVHFTLNTSEIPALAQMFAGTGQSTLSVLVKSVELPSYQVDTDTLNSYNRKRIVQSKINYQPVKVVMHDDSKDMARKLWYTYMQYYYKDSTHSYGGSSGAASPAGFNYNNRDIYAPTRDVNDWGYSGESFADSNGIADASGKPAFFRDISIYGMSQKKFAQYTLINPVITGFNHDTYDYSQNGGLENTMTIEYESVKYMEGAPANKQIPGFGNPDFYDTEPSALSRPGATNSILGPGGLVDAGAGIINDINDGNYLGALLKAGTARETFKGADLKSMLKTEAAGTARGVLRNVNSRGGFQFPKPSGTNTNTSSSGPLNFVKGFF